MYEDWKNKAIDVQNYYEMLCKQKEEIEKRIGIIQCMAKELIDEGADKFYSQRIFPQGTSHFNKTIFRLIKVVKEKSSSRFNLKEAF